MADIQFEGAGKARLPTKHHGVMTLSKAKWDEICGEPERYYYRLNGDKVATTLVAPDRVCHSAKNPSQFFYYKRFDKIMIAPSITAPPPATLMAVVVDTATGRVCTVYPTDKPTAGAKEYKADG